MHSKSPFTEKSIIPRSAWRADEPLETAPLRHPISYVFHGYTRSKLCVLPEVCARELKYLQDKDLRYKPDLRFNFLINSLGEVFEGRGWHHKPSLPYRYRDIQYTSLYIAFIGQYLGSPPPKHLLEAKNALIKFGMDNNFIEKDILEFNLEGLKEGYY